MRKILFKHLPGGLFILAAWALTAPVACVKVVPDKPNYDEDSTRQEFGQAQLRKKKVLIIGIDGASGTITQSLNTPVISELLPASIYTFNGLADTVTTVATGWTTLTTGVAYPTHQIKDSTLIPSSVKGSHAEIKYYESFISIVKLDDVATKVTAITAWEDMTSFLLSSADNVVNTPAAEGDQGVEAAAVANLTGSDADILLVNFNAPAVAGQASGFSAGNALYTKAILDTDTRIGKLITAMKARSTFAQEDWLVIVQSTSGGSGTVLGGRTQDARNTFSIYYSPALVPAAYTQTVRLVDDVVRFNGGAANYVRAENDDEGLYNVEDGAITVEAKVRFNPNAAGKYEWTYPPFISKVAVRSGNTPGWSMFKNGDKVSWFVADGSKKAEVTSRSIPDGDWHVLTGVAYKDGNDYKTAFYVDGEHNGAGTISGSTGNVTTASPFILGFLQDPFTGASGYIDMYMADIRVWNAALSDDEVKEWAFKSGDLSAHPKYANLIGYWPAMEGAGGVLKDLSLSKKDFLLKGNYTWNYMGNSFEPITSSPPALIDVVPSVYYWLGISLEGAKKPVGKNWLTLKVE